MFANVSRTWASKSPSPTTSPSAETEPCPARKTTASAASTRHACEKPNGSCQRQGLICRFSIAVLLPVSGSERRPDDLRPVERGHPLQFLDVRRAWRRQPRPLGRPAAVEEESLAASGRQQGEHVCVFVALDHERVRNATREKDEGAGTALELLVAGPEPQPALEHPERLVLAVVDMERRP